MTITLAIIYVGFRVEPSVELCFLTVAVFFLVFFVMVPGSFSYSSSNVFLNCGR